MPATVTFDFVGPGALAYPLRNILAVISVCWRTLMITVLALFFWLVYVKFPQH